MVYNSFLFPYLPAAACFPVVGKVITDPLVNLTQCHLLLWRTVDGKCDKAGIAIGRFAVLVLLDLLLIQCGVVIQQGALLAHAWPMCILGISLADSCLHGQLRKPIHGG